MAPIHSFVAGKRRGDNANHFWHQQQEKQQRGGGASAEHSRFSVETHDSMIQLDGEGAWRGAGGVPATVSGAGKVVRHNTVHKFFCVVRGIAMVSVSVSAV